jgi:hypothetical protein
MDDSQLEAAVAALADRDYRAAGDAYSRAGWQRLADPREGLSPFEADEKGWVGRALAALCAGTVAYRVAGADRRATLRAVEGNALARDLGESLDAPGQAACLAEMAADFRVAGGLDGGSEAYDRAVAAYEEAGADIDQPQALGTTPLFEAAAATVKQVARSTANGEIAVTWEDLHGADPADAGPFLAHRASYKSRRFPSLVAAVCEEGYLAAPRGTTEYNNAQFRCPACDSTDVNWVHDATLCMRCSTPVERA